MTPEAQKFRKKPVVVEAMQFTRESCRDCHAFVGVEHDMAGDDYRDDDDCAEHVMEFYIYTLEGEMCAEENDWIIRGVKGEFYPCKPDIFAATYEPAPPPTAMTRGGAENE